VSEVPKNILICLDGTKNQVEATEVTNVFSIAEFADLTDPAEQVLYYGPGVGTMAPPSAWTGLAQRISLVGGLALGHGMRQDIAEAYTYLMNTWEPGDKVFVFGFSRGAYTARALCGMLYRIGLLRPGSDNLVPYAVRTYARKPGKDSDLSKPEGWGRMDKYSEGLARKIEGESRAFPIEYLGLFDTVKATKAFGRDIRWPYTRQLPNVRVVRHAVSIDETRPQFVEYLVEPDPKQKFPALDEVWFAGVHSDVGGGFQDDKLTLSKIPMRWILDGAIKRGLKVRSGKYRSHLTKLGEAEACSGMRTNSTAWRFLQAPWRAVFKPWRTRPIPDDATIHGSVEIRMAKASPKYQPRLPAKFLVNDEPWSGPPPPVEP
jgi:uncharacterized protein (DUF2235 family)